MIYAQGTKYLHIVKQQAATAGATLTSDLVDTKGFDYVTFVVVGTTSDNATNNPSVLKVQEADDTNATSFADIAELVGDGASGFTVPSSPTSTTTAPFAVLGVSLLGRKRNLRMQISPLTTQTFSVVAQLTRANEMPNNTTEINAAVTAFA